MKRFFVTTAGILLGVVLWAGLLILAATQGWTQKLLAPRGDVDAFAAAAIEVIEQSDVGNAAFVLLDDGRVAASHFQSNGKPMNGDTLFQMASVSKYVTAWGVMRLVEQGRLDLDTPVDEYLSRWSLPETEHDNREVTVRRILSHSAGLTDGLGYAGFEDAADLQSLEDSLTQAADSFGPDRGATRMGEPADGTWRYSGGGYTLLQLLIEEVSGRDFNEFMQNEVLRPLGMSRSTFVVDRERTPNLADFYDTDGTVAPHYLYTALAAASLYTTANDLTLFLQAHLPGPGGESAGRGVVSSETLRAMREPHSKFFGWWVWGLGPILYAPNGSGDYVVGHDGGNRPAISTSARIDPASGSGLVLLTSGDGSVLGALGSGWVYWLTGEIGGMGIIGAVMGLFWTFVIGAGVILIAGVIIGWRYRRRPA